MLMVTTTEGMFNRLEKETAYIRFKTTLDGTNQTVKSIIAKKKLNLLTFIATPRTRGQQFLLALYLWYARPAFRMGLSIRPPPATTPLTYDIKHYVILNSVSKSIKPKLIHKYPLHVCYISNLQAFFSVL